MTLITGPLALSFLTALSICNTYKKQKRCKALYLATLAEKYTPMHIESCNTSHLVEEQRMKFPKCLFALEMSGICSNNVLLRIICLDEEVQAGDYELESHLHHLAPPP